MCNLLLFVQSKLNVVLKCNSLYHKIKTNHKHFTKSEVIMDIFLLISYNCFVIKRYLKVFWTKVTVGYLNHGNKES